MKLPKVLIPILMAMLLMFWDISPTHALSMVVHVPEKYTDVQAGERMYFEVEIKYPENPFRKDLRFNYEIKKDDEVIAQAQFLKAIETQASFMDYVVIPESTSSGLHVIDIAVSDYGDLDENVVASFNVIRNKTAQLQTYFFILLGVVILVGGLVVIDIKIGSKKK